MWSLGPKVSLWPILWNGSRQPLQDSSKLITSSAMQRGQGSDFLKKKYMYLTLNICCLSLNWMLKKKLLFALLFNVWWRTSSIQETLKSKANIESDARNIHCQKNISKRLPPPHVLCLSSELKKWWICEYPEVALHNIVKGCCEPNRVAGGPYAIWVWRFHSWQLPIHRHNTRHKLPWTVWAYTMALAMNADNFSRACCFLEYRWK